MGNGSLEPMAMAILDALAAHAAVMDADGTIVAANRAWSAFTEEHPGDPCRPAVGDNYLDACEQAARQGSAQALEIAEGTRSVLAGLQQFFHREFPWPRPDDDDFWFSVRVSPLSDSGQGAVISYTDITTRKHFETQLAYQALHDHLTRLPNRTLFLDRLSVALARMERSTSTVAVLFIDLDGFKQVNDSLGHDAGDQLLVAMATRIRGAIRPGDTAARYGGDEFTVLCEGITSELDAAVIAERISSEIRRPFAFEDTEICLTSSIGIAIATGRPSRPEALLRDADSALYRAKERGKGRYELFDSAMRQRAVERLETQNALRRALDRGELLLHFQPEVDLRSGAVLRLEALLRWQHPQLGLLTPSDWLPFAVDTGLGVRIGAWVVRQACLHAARWQAQPGRERVGVTVNLSPRELTQNGLVDTVLKAASEAGIDPSTVGVEIRQSSISAGSEDAVATVQRLRSSGITVAVDDFGTGYSPVTQLRDCPVDSVKIDRAAVFGRGDDNQAAAVVGALIELGHALGIRVVGKGVETDEHLAELRERGCDAAQGFLLMPPQDPAALEDHWPLPD